MRRWGSGLLGLLLIVTAGCYSWHPTRLEPNASSHLAANTRLVERNGQRVSVDGGYVTADSIVGETSSGQQIALARDSVAAVEVRSLSWPRIFGAVYGGLFAVGLLIGEKF